MSNLELNNVISTALREVLRNPQLKVNSESLLIGDLGLESIDFLDLTSELENSIGLEVDFKEVVQYVRAQKGQDVDLKSLTVDNLATFIQTKQS